MLDSPVTCVHTSYKLVGSAGVLGERTRVKNGRKGTAEKKKTRISVPLPLPSFAFNPTFTDTPLSVFPLTPTLKTLDGILSASSSKLRLHYIQADNNLLVSICKFIESISGDNMTT